MMHFLNNIFNFNEKIEDFEAVDNLGFDFYLEIASLIVIPLFMESTKPYIKEVKKVFINQICK